LLTHLTDTLTNLITNLYVTTGLLGIIVAMAIESCCIPLPSEIVMPLAGIMIASGKLLHGTNSIVALLLVALAGSIGCLIGSIVAYGIGYSGGRPLMLKYGRYVLISQHDADKADAFFKRWGSATAFFSRLLPVVRTYISLPAGIAKMPFVKFCIYTFLGSFPWSLLLAYIGLVLGNHLSTLSPIFHSLDAVILVVVVILVALYIWRHVRSDSKARAEDAQASQPQSPSQQQMTPQWNEQNVPFSQIQREHSPFNQNYQGQQGQQGQQPPYPYGQPSSQQRQFQTPPVPQQPFPTDDPATRR
jgi:membrane protein DedA with SNARE-associated domain